MVDEDDVDVTVAGSSSSSPSPVKNQLRSVMSFNKTVLYSFVSDDDPVAEQCCRNLLENMAIMPR